MFENLPLSYNLTDILLAKFRDICKTLEFIAAQGKLKNYTSILSLCLSLSLSLSVSFSLNLSLQIILQLNFDQEIPLSFCHRLMDVIFHYI
jgi:hypothetical protein